MILGLLLFSTISGACDPGDPVITMAAVAKTESGFDTLAIHDNTDGSTFHPVDEDAARHLAYTLIVTRGHSVDLGLMQINSANLSRVGLSIDNAFDACHSIASGARILKDGYQRALRSALSIYNTGNAQDGVANGYVRRVEMAAEHLPAINGGVPAAVSDNQKPPPTIVRPPTEDSWDAWAQDDDNSAVVETDGTAPERTLNRPAHAQLVTTPESTARSALVRVVMLQPSKNPEIP